MCCSPTRPPGRRPACSNGTSQFHAGAKASQFSRATRNNCVPTSPAAASAHWRWSCDRPCESVLGFTNMSPSGSANVLPAFLTVPGGGEYPSDCESGKPRQFSRLESKDFVVSHKSTRNQVGLGFENQSRFLACYFIFNATIEIS